jgi:5'-nucleotidase
LHDPMRFEARGEGRWSVTGTPVDCMITAFSHLLKGREPDLVLSGVNRGPNLGHDVYYSGTAAGAREGLMQGVPAVAFSLAGKGTYPFEVYEGVVTHLLTWITSRPPTTAHLLNINIPTPQVSRASESERFCGAPALRGVQITRLGERSYDNELIVRDDPRGKSYFWIGGEFPEMGDAPGTDCRALHDGYVSVTPVRLDSTHHEAVGEVAQQWTHWSEEST